ncbi:hypothetical protein MMC27_001641 [Xylographa pallens]|nr:hypothetical protein [Xylographa pallens]
MPFPSRTKKPFLKPKHKNDVQVLDPNLSLRYRTLSLFIQVLEDHLPRGQSARSQYSTDTSSTDTDTVLVLHHRASTPPKALPTVFSTRPPLSPFSHLVIMDGPISIHPHHFYPSLFPPPTADLPLHPSPGLAPLYTAAVRAAQQWSAHLEAWAAAKRYALARPPPAPVHACGEETMHPNHFFPWLFDEPTVFFPFYVKNGSPVAGLYEQALRAGQVWVALRREWTAAGGRSVDEEE